VTRPVTRPVTNMARSSSIFRSPAARERMQALYDRFLDRLGPPARRGGPRRVVARP